MCTERDREQKDSWLGRKWRKIDKIDEMTFRFNPRIKRISKSILN